MKGNEQQFQLVGFEFWGRMDSHFAMLATDGLLIF